MHELIYKKKLCTVIEEIIIAISLKLKNRMIIKIKEKNYLMLHHVNTLCQTKYLNS